MPCFTVIIISSIIIMLLNTGALRTKFTGLVFSLYSFP